MTEQERTRISKFMSLVLRHEPEAIGASLDEDGWLSAQALLSGIRRKHPGFTFEDLAEIVATSEKKRFGFSEDGQLIRAVQGHSVRLDRATVVLSTAPDTLYHGTAAKSVPAILEQGLIPMSRIHVHLSVDLETAVKVGSRHGKPAVFRVNAKAAQVDGIKFFIADNGVWLCDQLDPKYLDLLL